MAPQRKKRNQPTTGSGIIGVGFTGLLLIALIRRAGTIIDGPWLWATAIIVGGAVSIGAVLWIRRWLETWRVRWVLARTDLSTIDAMSGAEFEYRVADLMRGSGYNHVTVVGRAGDGGVDIRAETPDGHPCAVQCKRLKKPVSPNDIRAFQGVLANSHREYLGIFVSSQGFTPLATEEAGDSMVLVGRSEIGLWIAERTPPRLPY